METELLVAEQIARLFRGQHGMIYDLVATRGPVRADDVPIRGADGAPVAYARPSA